jgi:uncharacterized protein HemX
MNIDYVHLLEIIIVALIGIGGWLWRLGRKEQAQEDRIAAQEGRIGQLESWKESVTNEVRGDIGRVEEEAESNFERMETRLNRIEKKQHEQDVMLARIESNQKSQHDTLQEIKQDLRIIKGEARDGGNRSYDRRADV